MRNMLWLLKWLFGGVLFLYGFIPLSIYWYSRMVSHIVFVNMIRWPPFINFNKPQDVGLKHIRNFHLKSDAGTLGLWHTLPQSYVQEHSGGNIDYTASLFSGHPIVIYYHGNTGTRAGWHRVKIYSKLSQVGFHVIAVDYRGYGDSTGTPTEAGVCQDALTVYDWVTSHTTARVFLWGHSLGTAITVELVKGLSENGSAPAGMILEAPFNNIHEAACRHRLSLIFRWIPGFCKMLVDSMIKNDIHFSTDKNMEKVTTPVLILHAKDDVIVPYDLGQKLYTEVLRQREGKNLCTRFIGFEAGLGYGHKHIFRDPQLLNIIQEFVGNVSL